MEQLKSSGVDDIMAWMSMPATCDSPALALMRMRNAKLMQP